MSRILVTGAGGFIGRSLLPELLQQGHQVVGLSRTVQPASSTDIHWHHGDLTEPASLRGMADRCDAVVHLGGYAHATRGVTQTEIDRHRRINLGGTAAVLAEAAAAGSLPVIYISSVKAAGHDAHRCIDEDHARKPADIYGEIKLACEQAVLAYGREQHTHVCILRPALVYGPGVKGNLATMLAANDSGRFPPLPDTGNCRSMIDVRDVVRAILAAWQNPAANGRAYILSDGECYSTRRLYELMCRALGKPIPRWQLPAGIFKVLGYIGDGYELLLRRPAPIDSGSVSRLLESGCYRSCRIEAELGFKSEYRLEDALPVMVETYRHGIEE